MFAGKERLCWLRWKHINPGNGAWHIPLSSVCHWKPGTISRIVLEWIIPSFPIPRPRRTGRSLQVSVETVPNEEFGGDWGSMLEEPCSDMIHRVHAIRAIEEACDPKFFLTWDDPLTLAEKRYPGAKDTKPSAAKYSPYIIGL